MKQVLSNIYNGQILSDEEAYEVMSSIMSGEVTDINIAAFLSAINMRSFQTNEVKGFRRALLDKRKPISFDVDSIDLCGTGGDGKDTFNISTLSSFVVAGSGLPVTKHGNYGVSSGCGSSNVLEYLGAQFTNDTDKLRRQLENANICFLHAPLFHPAMRFVGPARKAMGVKTVFNILGPLVNPCQPKFQICGVFTRDIMELYAEILNTSCEQFAVLHENDGYDEISLTSFVHCLTNDGMTQLSAEDFKLAPITASLISGGKDVPSSSKIFKEVLEGKGSQAQNEVVFANAGMAIAVGRNVDLLEGIEQAKESLVSGRALTAFRTFIENQ